MCIKPVSVCNNVLPGQAAKSQKNTVGFYVVNLHNQRVLELKVQICFLWFLHVGVETAQTVHYVENILQP